MKEKIICGLLAGTLALAVLPGCSDKPIEGAAPRTVSSQVSKPIPAKEIKFGDALSFQMDAIKNKSTEHKELPLSTFHCKINSAKIYSSLSAAKVKAANMIITEVSQRDGKHDDKTVCFPDGTLDKNCRLVLLDIDLSVEKPLGENMIYFINFLQINSKHENNSFCDDQYNYNPDVAYFSGHPLKNVEKDYYQFAVADTKVKHYQVGWVLPKTMLESKKLSMKLQGSKQSIPLQIPLSEGAGT